MFLGKIVEKTLRSIYFLNTVPNSNAGSKVGFFHLRIANYKVHASKYSNMPCGKSFNPLLI